MNSIEIVGKNEEEAVEIALRKLGLKLEQVDVEVLAKVKPLLGFIGKHECKVKVTPKAGVKKEETLENFDVTADFFKSSIKEEKKYEKTKAQKNEEKQEHKLESKKEETKPEKKVEIKETTKVETIEKEPVKENIYLEEEGVKRIDLSSVYMKEKIEEVKEERQVKKAELTPEIKERIDSFLKNLFKSVDITASHTIIVNEDSIKVNVCGEEAARLIGRRGESLDSLQLLINLVANRGETEYTRVLIDIEGYRQKREESIIRYASKMARQAAKQKRVIKLDVMNPYERRIVHASLQNDRFVTTSSEGSEPYRRVVITPKTKREYK